MELLSLVLLAVVAAQSAFLYVSRRRAQRRVATEAQLAAPRAAWQWGGGEADGTRSPPPRRPSSAIRHDSVAPLLSGTACDDDGGGGGDDERARMRICALRSERDDARGLVNRSRQLQAAAEAAASASQSGLREKAAELAELRWQLRSPRGGAVDAVELIEFKPTLAEGLGKLSRMLAEAHADASGSLVAQVATARLVRASKQVLRLPFGDFSAEIAEMSALLSSVVRAAAAAAVDGGGGGGEAAAALLEGACVAVLVAALEHMAPFEDGADSVARDAAQSRTQLLQVRHIYI